LIITPFPNKGGMLIYLISMVLSNICDKLAPGQLLPFLLGGLALLGIRRRPPSRSGFRLAKDGIPTECFVANASKKSCLFLAPLLEVGLGFG